MLKKIFWISLFFSAALFLLQHLVEKNEWSFNNYYNLYYPGVLCIMTCTSTAIVLLYSNGRRKSIFALLQATGKMTLTNYITQNIIAFILFICIRPPWALHWYLITGAIIYMVQMVVSKWWLTKYNYGILEWLWRCLSYGQVFRLRKA